MGQSIGSLFPLRLRLWLGRLLFRPVDPKVVRVSWHRLIKGPCHPPEVEAMQYVDSHTTIPLPKVYATHVQGDGLIYIEMAHVEGDTLEKAWTRLSITQKDSILADVKQHVSILRQLQPPAHGIVSSAFQNPAYDGRIGARFYGPMNHDDFHSLARKHLIMEDVAPFLGEEVAKTHTAHYRTCFTHADLSPRNIMVKDGRVTAIIDWAYAGWYPEYWEFTKAHYSNFGLAEEWPAYISRAVPRYETELIAERALWTRLPEPGTTTTFHLDDKWVTNPGSSPSAAWIQAREDRQLKDLWSVALSRGDYSTDPCEPKSDSSNAI